MRKILCLSIVFTFLLSINNSHAQVSKEDIDKAIDISSLQHPYLYFTEQEKPALLSRIENDQESNDVFRKLKAEAKVWMHMPVDKDIPIQGKNTRAGFSEYDRDGKYGEWYTTNRDAAFYLAFLYQMTGEQAYADKAFEFADAFCDLTTWTRRAHEFPIIYSRIMPWNVPDDQVNFNFDHYNGDAARMMAAVYDWLYPALDQAQKDRIRGALIEKAVTRVRGDYEFHWWATAYRCNWCGVCNSGVGLAGLVLLTEHPQLTDIVAESYNRINSMLNELGLDGGWQEGGGYWNYGVHTSTFFADALKRMTNFKYNLFENERLKNNPVTFPLHISLPSKASLNFEDSGGGKLIGSTHLVNKLAVETNNAEAAWYRNEILGEADDIFDIIWERPSIEAKEPANPSIHFRTIDWWVMRSDFKDKSKVLVAGKAGMNDDPHHGHLDIGHFVVYWQGDYFIQDLGRIGYDEKYFDQARYDYPEASSIGHNTLFVNGEEQIPGKEYKQPYNYDVGGKVLDFRTSPAQDYVIMDPSNAYAKKELKKWRRHVVLDKPNVTLVVDEVYSDPGDQIEVRFHPGVDYKIEEEFVILEGEGGTMALIPLLNQDFMIKEGRHASQFVNATKGFDWRYYFDTEVKAKEGKTVIGTIIVPVKSKEDAQKILDSKNVVGNADGDLSVEFTSAGEKFSFKFTNEKEGLLLKK